MEDFARLLARLRGAVTLGYCCRSLDDDREMFPSPVLISAFRILSGEHAGDQDAFLRWLPDPTSFAARGPELCSDITEWWLWRACGDQEILNADEVIARSFPHLHQGIAATLERQSDRFTEYDGYVPQAGLDLDPTRPDGPVLSASRLEKLGSCPMGVLLPLRAQDRATRRISDRSVGVAGSNAEGGTPPRGLPRIHGTAKRRESAARRRSRREPHERNSQ